MSEELLLQAKIQNLLTPLEITTLAQHVSVIPMFRKQLKRFLSMKTLTEEQKRAITGALNNRLSVITGGPGTGKCLKPETHILLFDGSIKFAKELR